MQDIVIPDHDGQEDHEEEGASGASGGNFVKVRFSKFVQLVASHDFEEVMKERGDEEILVGPNLLTDLANAHEEAGTESSKKLPVMLLAGIIIGIVVTYLVLRF